MGCGFCGSIVSGLVVGMTSLSYFVLILLGQLLVAVIGLLRRK